MAQGSNSDDLQSAVEAGVIDAAQAEKLRAMRQAPPQVDDGVVADEERFRLLSGFNDVFLTIGVLLVAGAFLAAIAPGFAITGWLSAMVVAAIVFWVLSEILVGRMRAVLPGIALSMLFVFFAAAAVVVQMHTSVLSDVDVSSELKFWRNPTLLFSTPALIAAIVYYLRFRLPFALALIALTGYGVASKGLGLIIGSEATGTPIFAFLYGLVVLGAALAYDQRDLKRLTRLSDCAFWLHLVAAPFIVSPVILFIKSASHTTGSGAGVVLIAVLLLGVFALAIDRRALLVSSLTYFTFAVYDILSGGIAPQPNSAMPGSFVTTLALVGGFVLVLGVFWHPLRTALMPFFRSIGVAAYLPPAKT